MTDPPEFASDREFASRVDDVDSWRPALAGILARHDLDADHEPVAGRNATWPTFVCGDVVVKLFGHHETWRVAFAAERAALARVAVDPQIAAPRVLAEGRSVDGTWPYLVTTRVPGVAAGPDAPARDRRGLATDLGRQVRRLHALALPGLARDRDWPAHDPVAAAAQSSLPAHLVAQVEDFLARLEPADEVFVHADLVAQHVLVRDDRLSGIIDWGDALVADRHYELIQLFRDTFGCDGALLRAFLDASDWPLDARFPRTTLGQALRRQGLMLVQHPSGDVFEPIAERYPLDDIATLDELAEILFAV